METKAKQYNNRITEYGLCDLTGQIEKEYENG